MRSPSQATEAGFAQPWRTLGEIVLDCAEQSALGASNAQVHTLLEECMPVALTGADLRTAIESALLDALGRVAGRAAEGRHGREVGVKLGSAVVDQTAQAMEQTGSTCVRFLVVATHEPAGNLEGDSSGVSQNQQAGWSFFVIERPAVTSDDSRGSRKIIEVCLYHE